MVAAVIRSRWSAHVATSSSIRSRLAWSFGLATSQSATQHRADHRNRGAGRLRLSAALHRVLGGESDLGMDEGLDGSLVPGVGLAVGLDVSQRLIELALERGGLPVDERRKSDVDPLVERPLHAAVSLEDMEAFLHSLVQANCRDLRRRLRGGFRGTGARGFLELWSDHGTR